MKQILQNLQTGKTEIVAVPCPRAKSGHLLIRTSASVISPGTERMLVEFGKSNLLEKARQQPEKVRMVLDKIRTDGLWPTLEAVRSKLDQPIAMGYSNVGRVLNVGAGVSGFAVGDRIASNGHHAEVVNVPVNLCAHVPTAVPDESAAFTTLGAIALQGVRLAQPTLGEAVVVIGLGVVGLLTGQLLRAHGCRVFGIDIARERLDLAAELGMEVVECYESVDPVEAAGSFTRGRGADAVILTAATDSDELVHQAAQMSRKRGRIVLVGTVGLNLSRADFYEKELSFQVSCSYGPGRYDTEYEDRGLDYPIGFVRWTEQRNFEAVLDMMASGALDVSPLITHHFNLAEAESAYQLLDSPGNALGILLKYPNSEAISDTDLALQTIDRKGPPQAVDAPKGNAVIAGLIGTGNFGTRVLMPNMKKAGIQLRGVVSENGVSGTYVARKFAVEKMTTDAAELIADDQINSVVIATRHESHADLTCQALAADKAVFVEKPLAINLSQLQSVKQIFDQQISANFHPLLMVGFNRRFAPLTKTIRRLLQTMQVPKSLVYTINAGAIPADHWIQDPNIGGGRIVGECCHFIDLLRYMVDSPIVSAHAEYLQHTGLDLPRDTVSLSLSFKDGSMGTVHYFANGHSTLVKERLEVFCGGRVLQLNNFRALHGMGWKGFRREKLWRQDKGHAHCLSAFARAVVEGGEMPIPFAELVEVTRVSLELAEQLQIGNTGNH